MKEYLLTTEIWLPNPHPVEMSSGSETHPVRGSGGDAVVGADFTEKAPAPAARPPG
jgi:hypothetical protein